jgi:hypothetical protein
MHNGICIETQPSKQIQRLAPLSGSLAAVLVVVVWCGWWSVAAAARLHVLGCSDGMAGASQPREVASPLDTSRHQLTSLSYSSQALTQRLAHWRRA